MYYVRYALIGFRTDSDLVSQINREPFGCIQARININGSHASGAVWIMIRFSGTVTSITNPPITGSAAIWIPGSNGISKFFSGSA
jgi:hypothetical protein